MVVSPTEKCRIITSAVPPEDLSLASEAARTFVPTPKSTGFFSFFMTVVILFSAGSCNLAVLNSRPVRDNRLRGLVRWIPVEAHRKRFATFENYCLQRWRMNKSNQSACSSGKFVENLR